MFYKMKLLTLNTHSLVEGRGEAQISVLADAILAERFDVIALQEVNQLKEHAPISEGSLVKRGNFAAEVIEKLGKAGEKYYFSYLPIKLGYEKYDEGLAFLCRTPIIETRSILLSNPRSYIDWKKRMAFGIRCEGSDEWFWNLHTSWWEDSEEPFCAQWERFLAQLPREAFWVLGDLNNPAEVRGEGYDLLRLFGLFDAFMSAEKRWGEGTARSGIDGWRGRDVPCELLRIDQVWSSRPWRVLEYSTFFDGVRYPEISDHFGVGVTVENRCEEKTE